MKSFFYALTQQDELPKTLLFYNGGASLTCGGSPALIITFASATQAMAAEMFCEKEQLPGRIIPVPREITAGCGLAWKAPPEEENRIPARYSRRLCKKQSLS